MIQPVEDRLAVMLQLLDPSSHFPLVLQTKSQELSMPQHLLLVELSG